MYQNMYERPVVGDMFPGLIFPCAREAGVYLAKNGFPKAAYCNIAQCADINERIDDPKYQAKRYGCRWTFCTK